MNDKLIEQRVNTIERIDEKVMNFISVKGTFKVSPFEPQEEIKSQTAYKPKRSLTDWRYLYSNHSKILPDSSITCPQTSNGKKIRSTNRINKSNKSNYSFTETKRSNHYKTEFSHFHKTPLNNYPQSSLIDHAMAQSCLEIDILKDGRCKTPKEKKINERKMLLLNGEFKELNRLIVDLKKKKNNPLETRIRFRSELKPKMGEDYRIQNFNTVNIGEKYILKGSCMQTPQKFQEGGLRFYERR